MHPYRVILIILWIAGSIGGAIYSQQKNIPPAVAIPVALAFLVEASLYLGLGRLRYPSMWLLAGSALVPYLILVAPLGLFSWKAAATLAGLAVVQCWWLPIAGQRLDPLFLALTAGVYMSKILDTVYPEVGPIKVDALGQLMWFRLGVTSVLENRNHPRLNFGFVPKASEWLSGLFWFACFAPVGYGLSVLLKFAHPHLAEGWWWKGPGTFVGIFLTVALGEEIFFRGLLLERIKEWWGLAAAIVVSSLVFGVVHLWFRQFPNYKHVAMTVALGVFCALAYVRGRSVRASMVSHALVVAAWRIGFV